MDIGLGGCWVDIGLERFWVWLFGGGWVAVEWLLVGPAGCWVDVGWLLDRCWVVAWWLLGDCSVDFRPAVCWVVARWM